MAAGASLASGLMRGLAAGKGIKLDREKAKAAETEADGKQIDAAMGLNGGDPRVRPGGDPALGFSQGAGGLLGYIDQTEGAGGYDTLYGHSQREGGRFAGTRVSDMTIGELYDFTDPKGEYGAWVAQERTKAGEDAVVATPLGRFQVVGSTLRSAAEQMRLDPATKFTPVVQKQIGTYLIGQRLARAGSMDEKVNQLRQEWVGLKKVPTPDLVAAIREWEGY